MLLRLALFLVAVALCGGGGLCTESLDHSSSRPPPSPAAPPSPGRWQTVGSGRGPLGTLRAAPPTRSGQADRLRPTVAGELDNGVTDEAGMDGSPRDVFAGLFGSEIAGAVNEICGMEEGMEEGASNEDMLEDAPRASADSREWSVSPSSDETAPCLSDARDALAGPEADAPHLAPSSRPGTHGAAWSEGAAGAASRNEEGGGGGEAREEGAGGRRGAAEAQSDTLEADAERLQARLSNVQVRTPTSQKSAAVPRRDRI